MHAFLSNNGTTLPYTRQSLDELKAQGDEICVVNFPFPKGGDKVRILRNHYGHPYKKGEVVTILDGRHVDETTGFVTTTESWCIGPDEYVFPVDGPVILKYGDRVTVSSSYLNDEAGPGEGHKFATVLTDELLDDLIRIQYDAGSLDFVPRDVLEIYFEDVEQGVETDLVDDTQALTEVQHKDVALFVALFYYNQYSKKSLLQTFDVVYQMAVDFVRTYPEGKTWEDESWEDAAHEFIAAHPSQTLE